MNPYEPPTKHDKPKKQRVEFTRLEWIAISVAIAIFVGLFGPYFWS